LVYLIDGNNLLYAAQSHGPERAIGRVQLCRVIKDWAIREGVTTWVIFDGPRPPDDRSAANPANQIRVRYSGRRTADEIIEDMVAETPRPGEITVVTTDRAIQHAVRYRRARCIDSEDFVSLMYASTEPAAPPQEHSPPEKPQALTSQETDRWLAEFGDLPEAFADDADRWLADFDDLPEDFADDVDLFTGD
jgi:predicted RNA-binding protein with PIN domain